MGTEGCLDEGGVVRGGDVDDRVEGAVAGDLRLMLSLSLLLLLAVSPLSLTRAVLGGLMMVTRSKIRVRIDLIRSEGGGGG